MYRCLDCGGLWLECELAVVNTPNYHGPEIGWEDYYTSYCPRCGGEEIEEEVIDLEEDEEGQEDGHEDDGAGVPGAPGNQPVRAMANT